MDANTGKRRKSYSHAKLDAKKDRKRLEADARKAHYRSLTTQEKIKLVQSRYGESKRELARLNQELETEKRQVEWNKAQQVTAKVANEETPPVAKKMRTRKSDVVKAAKAK